MGFLEVGSPMSWDESQNVIQYVKEHGIKQLLYIWKLNKNRQDSVLCWGEEIEYTLVSIDSSRLESSIYSCASEVLEDLQVREHIRPKRTTAHLLSEWHPEFGNHMVEALPSPPYLLKLNSILLLEPSMRLRRAKIQSILPESKYVTSQTAFPRLGLRGFVVPEPARISDSYKNLLETKVTKSVFIPDSVINPHPRFGTLVANIRARRKTNPYIKIPIYKDKYTGKTTELMNKNMKPWELEERDWSLSKSLKELDRFKVEQLARKTINPVKDHIYMDCFAFGMGTSCVQTTFACPNIKVARFLYDQLAVLAPIFLALTASTPFQRGLLADYDVRWATLEQAVDCRTEEEEFGYRNDVVQIEKSRYSGISRYMADSNFLKKNEKFLNDTNAPCNEKVYSILKNSGMDDMLANHFAHLWIRDPLVIFHDKVLLDDTRAVDHFENIQSTNWNSVRFKPPPPHIYPLVTDEITNKKIVHKKQQTLSPIGWRVEFRSPEVQLTDFDNAGGVGLISVLTQCILHYNLNLYIPMSMNDINMHRSWKRNAITEQKFFFRKTLLLSNSNENNGSLPRTNGSGEDDFCLSSDIVEMTLAEILEGSQKHGFVGLIPLCEQYIKDVQGNTVAAAAAAASTASNTHDLKSLDHLEACCDNPYGKEVQFRFTQYASLFVDRATGRNLTGANFLRQFILRHPLYKQDSVIDPVICHDVTALCTLLGFGVWVSPDLHGECRAKHLVLQTPLPATTELPSLSKEGLSVISLHSVSSLQSSNQTTASERNTINGSVENNSNKLSLSWLKEQYPGKIILYEKPSIALNTIDSIYTMPIGVTARTGTVHKVCRSDSRKEENPAMWSEKLKFATESVTNSNPVLCKTCSNKDLFKVTLEMLQSIQKPASSSKKAVDNNGGACAVASSSKNVYSVPISSEEFTQAWILKGIDLLGGTVADGAYLPSGYSSLYDDQTNQSTAGVSSSICVSKPGVTSVAEMDRLSTVCPSSVEDPSTDDENDRIHELSRSLSFGFGNEQELEYFQQVCGSSA